MHIDARKKKILFLIFLSISTFFISVFLSSLLNKRYDIRKKEINNIAYCLTLKDYLIKINSKKSEDNFNKKAEYVVLQSLVRGNFNILQKTCPVLVKDFLKLDKKLSKKYNIPPLQVLKEKKE